jgi:putative transposase
VIIRCTNHVVTAAPGRPNRTRKLLWGVGLFYRRKLPHFQRDNKDHFITFCTCNRWPLPEVARDIVAASCLHDNGTRYDLTAFVVMPDHVHLILAPIANLPENRIWALPEILDAIKGASAHLINKHLARRGSVWQAESFDRVLRCSEKVEERVQYVIENPVRQGLVRTWQEYRWLWVRPFANRYAAEPARFRAAPG